MMWNIVCRHIVFCKQYVIRIVFANLCLESNYSAVKNNKLCNLSLRPCSRTFANQCNHLLCAVSTKNFNLQYAKDTSFLKDIIFSVDRHTWYWNLHTYTHTHSSKRKPQAKYYIKCTMTNAITLCIQGIQTSHIHMHAHFVPRPM